MNPAAPSFSAAARGAGIVLAAGYVAGVASGPVLAVVGALALITFGRILIAPRAEAALDAAALALLSASLLVGALRLGSLDLVEIRGAQTVLGPTLLLGPRAVGGATWLAAAAGIVALAEWEAFPGKAGRAALVWWIVETLLGAVALVAVFWGPDIAWSDEASRFATGPAAWALATLCVSAGALGVSFLVGRLGVRARAGILIAVLIAVAVAIGAIGVA